MSINPSSIVGEPLPASPATSFLDAVFAADSSVPVPLFIEGAPVAYDANLEGSFYTRARTEAGIAFVYSFYENVEPNHWESTIVPVTSAIYKDGNMICVWALDVIENPDAAMPLAQALGMDGFDEEIPVPPTDGWELVHCDVDTFHTLAALVDIYVSGDACPNVAQTGSTDPTYIDATVKRPYDPAWFAERPFTYAFGKNKKSLNWTPETVSLSLFVDSLCKHIEGPKNGPAFVVGDMVRGQRLKNSVKAMYGIGLDLDSGTLSADVDAALSKLDCLSIRYTTHSHNTKLSEFKKDRVVNWAAGREIDNALFREFLTKEEGWDPSIVATAECLGTEHNEKGIVFQVRHCPMPKHRVIIPVEVPYDVATEGTTQREATDKWAQVIAAAAALLGLPYDHACVDPSRLYYFPRHAKGKTFEISLFGSEKLFDWRTLNLSENHSDSSTGHGDSKRRSKSVTPEGRALGKWGLRRGAGFQIIDVLEEHAPDRIRGDRKTITCPNDEKHTKAGDPNDSACFAVNAGEGPSEWFVISCRHDSCAGWTCLDHLGKMLKDRWFDRSVLENESFCATIVDEETGEENAPGMEREPTTGRYGASLLDQASKLNEDSSAAEVDAILAAIAAKEVSSTVADDVIKELHAKTGKAKGGMRETLKRFRADQNKKKKKEKTDRTKGVSPENAAKFWFDDIADCVEAINQKCAIVMRGEGMRYVFRDVDDKPLFLKEADARIKLGQYLVFIDEDEPPQSGFRLWNQSPERKEYSRVVFNPRNTDAAADELNLWTGFAAKAVEGDWSLLRAHIFDNICQGNKEHYTYLLDWIAQMIQEPWRKPGVAIILRGGMGVGKSKLPEWLAKMVGERHSLVVDKADQWTGRFNAKLETCIFLTCEEALFAGSKEAKSTIKHLITAPRMAYEQKGQALYEGPNFTRVFMASNEDWVIPADTGERRYFVLDVGDARQEDKAYFAAIDAQMEDGGLEAMLFDLRERNIKTFHLTSAPKTEALADQIRVGLSPARKWLESVMTEGEMTYRDDDGDRRRVELSETVATAIPNKYVLASYREAVPGYRSPATPADVGNFLKRHVPGLRKTRKNIEFDSFKSVTMETNVRHWVFPALMDMRTAFLKANPGYTFSEQVDEVEGLEAGNVLDLNAEKGKRTGGGKTGPVAGKAKKPVGE